MELKCTNLQNELLVLQKEVKVDNSLQEVVTIHGSHSTLDACTTELKDSLKNAEERYKVAWDFVEETACRVENYGKDAESLKSLKDEVAGLRRALNDALQPTMQNVLEDQE